MSESKKPNNVKTGLILASVALVFFASVFIKHIWYS
ncbi:MAG: cytochrome oxidase small assembly protein [Pseudomonadota bacterium]